MPCCPCAGSPVTPCCPGEQIPTTLYVTFTFATLGGCLDDGTGQRVVACTFDAANSWWYGTADVPCTQFGTDYPVLNVVLQCLQIPESGDWYWHAYYRCDTTADPEVVFLDDGNSDDVSFVMDSCDPLAAHGADQLQGQCQPNAADPLIYLDE